MIKYIHLIISNDGVEFFDFFFWLTTGTNASLLFLVGVKQSKLWCCSHRIMLDLSSPRLEGFKYSYWVRFLKALV